MLFELDLQSFDTLFLNSKRHFETSFSASSNTIYNNSTQYSALGVFLMFLCLVFLCDYLLYFICMCKGVLYVCVYVCSCFSMGLAA